jgi:hypothetical protein
MAWWDRIGDGARQDEPRPPAPAHWRARSVYEDPQRLQRPAHPKIIFSPTRGLLGVEVDGKFVPSDGRCCEDPLYCDRRECWRPLGRR